MVLHVYISMFSFSVCVCDDWYTRLRDYMLILVSVQVHVILHGVVVIIFYHIGQSLIFLNISDLFAQHA